MKLVINKRKIEESHVEKGWSISRLAKESKVTPIVVTKTINGQSIPQPSTLKRIADALGLKVMDIASIEDGCDISRNKAGRKRKIDCVTDNSYCEI